MRSFDDKAILGLYDQCAPTLYALLIRMLGNREIATMVLRETFVDFWQSGSVPDKERVLPMLIKTAHKKASVYKKASSVSASSDAGPGELLRYVYFSGCTAAEAAERLDLPVSTVQHRLVAAMKMAVCAPRSSHQCPDSNSSFEALISSSGPSS